MEKIASFQIDHTNLPVGMYISRQDKGVTTYDLRLTRPNSGRYLTTGAAHTIEHLFATYARNSAFKDNIIYVGPMGCRTGLYLLTADLPHKNAITLAKEALRFIADFEGEIPGCSPVECGNSEDHDKEGAKEFVKPLLEALTNYTEEKLNYPL